jgi:putative transposase
MLDHVRSSQMGTKWVQNSRQFRQRGVFELRKRTHCGCAANPDGRWTNPASPTSFSEQATPARFLIRDRDSKFSRAFDEVFPSEGVQIIRTPFRAPQANAFAERWVGTVRRDCLD